MAGSKKGAFSYERGTPACAAGVGAENVNPETAARGAETQSSQIKRFWKGFISKKFTPKCHHISDSKVFV